MHQFPNPETSAEDFVWLVYSDWLEERGQNERANKVREETQRTDNTWNREWRDVGVGGVSNVVGGDGVVGGVGGSVVGGDDDGVYGSGGVGGGSGGGVSGSGGVGGVIGRSGVGGGALR